MQLLENVGSLKNWDTIQDMLNVILVPRMSKIWVLRP